MMNIEQCYEFPPFAVVKSKAMNLHFRLILLRTKLYIVTVNLYSPAKNCYADWKSLPLLKIYALR